MSFRLLILQGNESLQVVLVKQGEEFTWPSLLKGSTVPPSDLPAQSIRELALPPSNLRTEMEECDFGDDEMDKEYSFGKTSKRSHELFESIGVFFSNKF